MSFACAALGPTAWTPGTAPSEALTQHCSWSHHDLTSSPHPTSETFHWENDPHPARPHSQQGLGSGERHAYRATNRQQPRLAVNAANGTRKHRGNFIQDTSSQLRGRPTGQPLQRAHFNTEPTARGHVHTPTSRQMHTQLLGEKCGDVGSLSEIPRPRGQDLGASAPDQEQRGSRQGPGDSSAEAAAGRGGCSLRDPQSARRSHCPFCNVPPFSRSAGRRPGPQTEPGRSPLQSAPPQKPGLGSLTKAWGAACSVPPSRPLVWMGWTHTLSLSLGRQAGLSSGGTPRSQGQR